jgi:predicted peroxiredoxin
MTAPRARLVVKVTCGTESLERLNQGFTVAATAAASGALVSLCLAADAAWMAVPDRAEEVELPHAAVRRLRLQATK